ncbi:MAG TPA: sulfite exporter TauE/SafE family protein [Candidatus Azoamicus sp.]
MNENISFITAFLLGFFGNLHCFGMCGGIITALSLNILKNKKKIFIYQIIYNSSRILSYCFIGMFVNIFGFFIFDFLNFNIKFIFNVFLPIIIIFFGMRLLNIFSSLFFQFEKISYDFFNFLNNKIYLFTALKSPYKEFIIGMLWGSMPCNLVYSALAITFISSSIVKSFLIMMCFGIGTLPAIFFAGSFYSKLIILKRNNFLTKIIGFLTISYGFFFLIKILIKKECHLQQIIFYFS